MQAANRLQKALRTGSGLSFGAWQMLPGSNHSRTIARCGFDWVCVDTEHGNIDGMDVLLTVRRNVGVRADIDEFPDAAMHEAVAAIAGCGVSPIVRIAANEGWMVKSEITMLSPLLSRLAS